MALLINVLSIGAETPASYTFLFPLLRHRSALARGGIEFRIHNRFGPEFLACDQAWVDAKFYGAAWSDESDRVLNELANAQQTTGCLLLFDTYDSTGALKSEALPVVDGYYKSQLLRDTDTYTAPLYGQRLHTDYYHREFEIEDTSPLAASPVSATDLRKLGVSWNSGLADFGLLSRARRRAYAKTGSARLIGTSKWFGNPRAPRPLDMALHMTTEYSRETVAYQRREVVRRLGATTAPKRLPRILYLTEMRWSKVIPSPFGWGEINYRDFECLRNGSLLFKPSMDHLVTWPAWYQNEETYIGHRWDFEDLHEQADRAVRDRDFRVQVASAGQRLFRRMVATEAGTVAFVERVREIAEAAERGEIVR